MLRQNMDPKTSGMIGGKVVGREVAEDWKRSMSARAQRLLQRSDKTGYCAGCMMIDDQTSFYHHDYEPLGQSARAGCPLCRILFHSLGLATASGVRGNSSCRINIDYKANKLYYKVGGAGESVFELFIPRGTFSSYRGSVPTNRSLGLSPDNSNVVKLRDIQPSPESEVCYSLAQNWLKSCVETHSRCSQADNILLPTRLLEVSGDEIYLRLSENIPETPLKYATLSYCWGSQRHLMTTTNTLTKHQEGILTKTLPKSLYDAVTVTRNLGLRYLWIDSLCILQDSAEDWTAECTRMGDYYRYSFLTISALDSPDAQQGFLNPRSEILTAPLSPSGSIWVRSQLLGRHKVFNNAALSQRGWALQERLLATRIIHYGKSELFWECLTCSAREGSGEEHRTVVDPGSLVDSDGEDFKRAMFNLSDDPYSIKDGAFALWYRLVKQYTKRSLTRSSDKLPAISGLATMIGAQTQSSYFTGIWEQDLHGLAWSKDVLDRKVDGTEDPEKQRWAPSWSWASVSGPVSYRFYEEERTGSVNDAKLVEAPPSIHETEDNDEPLTSCLTLKVLFKQVRCLLGWLNAQKHIANFVPENGDSEEYHPPGSWWVHAYRAGFIYDIYDLNGNKCGVGSFDKHIDAQKPHKCAAIWIAERAYERRVENETPVRQIAVYLLLIVPYESLKGCWRRIGVGVTREFGRVPWVNYSNAFEGAEWTTIKLI